MSAHHPPTYGGRPGGFTLIELMLAVALMGVFTVLAVPVFYSGVQSARVRTVAEGIQNDLRLARTEAIRRDQPVSLNLSNSIATTSTPPTAVTNGKYWNVYTVALNGGDAQTLVSGGSVANLASGVTITGPATVTFSPYGRYSNPPTTMPSNSSGLFAITASNGHTLNINVGLGGQVRMCDPARTISSSNPDAC